MPSSTPLASFWLDHPSAVVVPVILTLGPAVQATGERAVAAYVARGELAAHLGRATAALQYNRGWHTTSTIGVLAAAATARACSTWTRLPPHMR